MAPIMKTKINWLNHFIEVIVVIIGISIAFILNNWRENYSKKLVELKYIESFREDINIDFENLENVLEKDRQKKSHLERYIASLKMNAFNIDSTVSILSDMLTNYNFNPQTSTYQAIISSAHINYVTNYELKKLIISYYKNFEELEQGETIYNMYVNNYVVPFVYDNLDLLENKIIDQSVLRQKKHRNLIVGYYALLMQKVTMYEDILSTNIVLKDKLSGKTAK